MYCCGKLKQAAWGIALFGIMNAAGVALADAPYQHVLILSIDGLREADLADPATAAYLPNIRGFEHSAIHYSDAHTVVPSDSVPASLSYFTGAGPKTTGVYYEDSYDRSLYAAGGFLGGPQGTLVSLREVLESNAKVKLQNGALVDSSKGERITKQLTLSQAYDDMRLFALTNQMSGYDSRRIGPAPTPAIYGMNFLALNTAEKDSSGGISLDASGNEL